MSSRTVRAAGVALALASLALLAPAGAARAAAPEIKFPLTFTTALTPGRSYSFAFTIWTAAVGGARVGTWTEGPVLLPVASNRTVYYVLGTKKALPALNFVNQYWVQIAAGTRRYRTRLPAAGYAFWSARVATLADRQVTAAMVGSEAAAGGMVLAADGSGGAAWQAQAAGGITEIIAGNGLGGGGTSSPVTLELAAPVAVANGGTGGIDPIEARANLGAAASGANEDITSLGALTTPLTIAQGGTGADLKSFVDLSTAQTVAGVKTFSDRMVSTVATGTAPLTVSSTTTVANLSADMLDGYHSTYFAPGLHTHDTPFWRLGGNTGTTAGTDYLGTGDNVALEVKVNGARAMRFEPQPWAPNVIAGAASNGVRSGVSGAFVAGGSAASICGPGFVLPCGNTVSDTYGTVAGGIFNVAGDDAGTATDRVGATVGGGVSNTAAGLESTVAGGTQNEASGTAAFVGGGEQNRAFADRATIAGGQSNQAGAAGAFIGGGSTNAALGQNATVGGGLTNTANGQTATVAGGTLNSASSTGAAVAGGASNNASGAYATVAGGRYSQAGGDFSLAAGYRAKVRDAVATGDADGDEGSFVWADYADMDFVSTGPRQFLIRATGGVGINTNAPAEGMALDVNGSVRAVSFVPTSDRNAKEGFVPVDGREVLAKLAALPVTSWKFRGEPGSVRHLGPVAQDFRAAFGLGYNDTTIATVDADGVALAAIQGLNAIVEGQRAELAQLRARLEAQALLIERLLEKTAAR